MTDWQDPNEILDTETNRDHLSLCVSDLCLSVCLVFCQFVTVRLNGEVETLKCGNGAIREIKKTKCKKQNSRVWVRDWENTNWWGRREMKWGKKKKTTLWGISVCYEHRATAWKHRHCRSLHQPAFHHRDFQLNCNLICNTIILAYIPGYITLWAKSWPQSAKQLLLLRSKLLISTEVCGLTAMQKSHIALLIASTGWVWQRLPLNMIYLSMLFSSLGDCMNFCSWWKAAIMLPPVSRLFRTSLTGLACRWKSHPLHTTIRAPLLEKKKIPHPISRFLSAKFGVMWQGDRLLLATSL